MNLVQSTIGVDSGLSWETNLNSSLTTIDQHNHASGNGVPISPAGMNINANLPFAGFQITGLGAALFTNQTSLATLNALYTIAGDLYYNDATGPIQITLGGAVNATSSGISSGAASAAFSSGVLIVNAAANTPANIQCGSVLLGNNVAASNFLTLAPPAAMGAGFTLTLPSIPAQTNVVTLDTSGNISSTTWNTVAANRTRAVASTVAAGGVAISSSSSVFNTTNTSATTVTNLSVTITTSGRPVQLNLISDGTGGNISEVFCSKNTSTDANGTLGFYRDGSFITLQGVESRGASGSILIAIPSSAFSHTDPVAAGTYTYTVKVAAGAGTTIGVNYTKLVAYEL